MYNFFYDDKANCIEGVDMGNCAFDPSKNALAEGILYEIRHLAYYLIKIKEMDYENIEILDEILDTLSSLNFGFNYKPADIEAIILKFRKYTVECIRFYTEKCEEKGIECQSLQSSSNCDLNINLKDFTIKGEKQAINKNSAQFENTKKFFDIITILSKDVAKLIMKLNDFGIATNNEKYSVLKLINQQNIPNQPPSRLIKKIQEFAQPTSYLLNLLYDTYEKVWGKQKIKSVRFDTKIGKSILVSGDNLKDLDDLLKATANVGINVYTHDRMILAFAYPHFQKYPHLVGHYQSKLNQFRLDFSNFPGPVLLSKDYSSRLDCIYRGNIFSSDFIAGHGISIVKNKNFNPLILAAKQSDGFSVNKKSRSFKIGYNFSSIENKIDNIVQLVKDGKYNKVFIIGELHHTFIKNPFFDTIIEKISKDNFIFSLAHEKSGDNIFHLPTFYDYSLLFRIVRKFKEKFNNKKMLPLRIILTQCINYSVSAIVALKYYNVEKIYMLCDSLNTLNPAIINCLKQNFGVLQLADNIQLNENLD